MLLLLIYQLKCCLYRYLVVLENIWAEVLLQDLDAASTVALMVTGLEIANLETGRTSVTVVGKEVT